jgi:hypothetical protein
LERPPLSWTFCWFSGLPAALLVDTEEAVKSMKGVDMSLFKQARRGLREMPSNVAFPLHDLVAGGPSNLSYVESREVALKGLERHHRLYALASN